MGVYLSCPVTDKISLDGRGDNFVYGASSMQGWRITQEDAHNCIPVFDEKTKTAFFAVYDGHGGAEVAKYCEQHFPNFVKSLLETKNDADDPASFIKKSFLEFDATLTTEEVIKELKELAGDDDIEEEDEDDPVGRKEAELLKEEATMPLEQLLAKYNKNPAEELKQSHKPGVFQSPALRSKREAASSGASSSSTSSSLTHSSSLSSSSAPHQIPNGETTESNGNQTTDGTVQSSKDPQSNQLSTNGNVLGDSHTDTLSPIKSQLSTDIAEDKSPSSILSGETQKTATDNHSKECCESSPGQQEASLPTDLPASTKDTPQHAADTPHHAADTPQHAESSGQAASPDHGHANAVDEPSGSGCSSVTRLTSRKVKQISDTDGDLDTSDDEEDEEEDEDEWENESDEEDDDEDPESEDDMDEDVPTMPNDEEPGSDSGCTACVVLMQEKKLIVANAGDSRCVLSRAGKAIDLSFDHKPEDDSERERIEHAGGKVTADGRVNGGLNLSRAIGDHVYKQNKELPPECQMITALPDVETAELTDEDQFIVLACDGIWNYMSSQEVVDFVLTKLKDAEKRQQPSLICEELFDHCLAPNTAGDGTGCDNMTCIIVLFSSFKGTYSGQATVDRSPVAGEANSAHTDGSQDTDQHMDLSDNTSEDVPVEKKQGHCGTGSLKRCNENLEVSQEKRLKVQGELT